MGNIIQILNKESKHSEELVKKILTDILSKIFDDKKDIDFIISEMKSVFKTISAFSIEYENFELRDFESAVSVKIDWNEIKKFLSEAIEDKFFIDFKKYEPLIDKAIKDTEKEYEKTNDELIKIKIPQVKQEISVYYEK